jgi:hypothetical protein
MQLPTLVSEYYEPTIQKQNLAGDDKLLLLQ